MGSLEKWDGTGVNEDLEAAANALLGDDSDIDAQIQEGKGAGREFDTVAAAAVFGAEIGEVEQAIADVELESSAGPEVDVDRFLRS